MYFEVLNLNLNFATSKSEACQGSLKNKMATFRNGLYNFNFVSMGAISTKHITYLHVFLSVESEYEINLLII